MQADEAQTMQTKVAKPRARLTQDEVLEIYSQKGRGLSASKICLRFGITEKAVRDIWTGRTWVKETTRLDPLSSTQAKKSGRLIGRKDGALKLKSKKSRPVEASDSNMPNGLLQKKKQRSKISTIDSLTKDNVLCFDLPIRSISIDAEINEWHKLGCWIDTRRPSVISFLQ